MATTKDARKSSSAVGIRRKVNPSARSSQGTRVHAFCVELLRRVMCVRACVLEDGHKVKSPVKAHERRFLRLHAHMHTHARCQQASGRTLGRTQRSTLVTEKESSCKCLHGFLVLFAWYSTFGVHRCVLYVGSAAGVAEPTEDDLRNQFKLNRSEVSLMRNFTVFFPRLMWHLLAG